MKKYAYFSEKIVELIEENISNTDIAKQLIPDGTFQEIEYLRRLVGSIRRNGIDNMFQKPSQKIKNKIPKLKKRLHPILNLDKSNILIIGDLHEPFTKTGYLEFCREQQQNYNCGTIIFIGDLIDNHFSSYHETDPDGYSAGEELDLAIQNIQDWYYTFPQATVIIGNHDRLVHRKAFSSGLSKRWIKDYSEVLETPSWNFVENINLFGINFNHGEGGTARNRAKNELQSQVQGHLHTQLYTEFLVGANYIIFGMQVGCGVDNKSYAMAYGRNFKKPAIGCGVVLNEGKLPISIPMELK
jgi:hypothetical protein